MKSLAFLASVCVLLAGIPGVMAQDANSLECEIDTQRNCISEPYMISPLKQFSSGVELEEIFCHPNMTLIVKQSTGTPACVFNTDKLVERGWGVTMLDTVMPIQNFEECVKAGNPVMESHPRQCMTADGEHSFVETIDLESTDPTILYVNSKLVDCVGVGPQQCMMVKENPDSEWEFFYEDIEGFDFEEGIEYKLSVIIEDVKNPPADASSKRYILHEIIEPSEGTSSKRSPVSVPDATNENDMLCQTHWNIITSEELNTDHLKQSVQSTIAQFGSTYFLEEREITVSNSSAGYTVSVSGLWDPKSVQYSMITDDLQNFSGSEVQGEPAMCQ
ncbi:DUF4377 domain-containing protein [Nitrosopumilus sp.]|uniref:DUF4377 domain-containing protein n=1 Tax=Nitrosopumilus sp. TaxID=2024843 RepID=UPI00292FEB7A|nr:DUF4377 domain-containing protein [Nitrosopumilus sp.]